MIHQKTTSDKDDKKNNLLFVSRKIYKEADEKPKNGSQF